MGQVTIYLDEDSERRLKAAARAEGMPVSRWIAGLVRKEIRQEWPSTVRDLAGAWMDDFPDPETLRQQTTADTPREPL